MLTKRRISPSSSRSRSPMPGNLASSSLRQSPTVPAPSSEMVVSLFVSVRSVLGIRTLTAISAFDDVSFYWIHADPQRGHGRDGAVYRLLGAVQLQHDPALVLGHVGPQDVGDDVVFHAHVVNHRLLDQIRRKGELDPCPHLGNHELRLASGERLFE